MRAPLLALALVLAVPGLADLGQAQSLPAAEAPPPVIPQAPVQTPELQMPGAPAPLMQVPTAQPPTVPGQPPAPVMQPGRADEAAPLVVPKPDYSLRGMVMAAHWVVKTVMALLALAVFSTLTVLLYKTVQVPMASFRLGQSARKLQMAPDLATAALALRTARDPAALMVVASAEELARSADLIAAAGGAGVAERVRSHLDQIEAAALRRLRAGSGLLASIAAVAPFVGLFGTVWGIMFSFISIAETKTTNLAVVAPGIAEALLATAIGLVAAIPAVVVYNLLSRRVAAHRHGLSAVAAVLTRQLSRELDQQVAAFRTGSHRGIRTGSVAGLQAVQHAGLRG